MCACVCACACVCVCVFVCHPHLYQVPHLTLQQSLQFLVAIVLDHNELKLLCVARDHLTHLQPCRVLTQQFDHVHGQQSHGMQGNWTGRAFTSNLVRGCNKKKEGEREGEERGERKWRREKVNKEEKMVATLGTKHEEAFIATERCSAHSPQHSL